MTVLERIRSRAGLLVGVIMLALLAFILGDFLSGRYGSRGGSNDIGVIAGHVVKAQEWQDRENIATNEFAAFQRRQPVETDMENIRQQLWQEMLDKYIFEEGEYDKLALALTDDELAEEMLSNRPNPVMRQVFGSGQQDQRINPQFAAPDGFNLDMNRVRQYVKSLSPDKEESKDQYYRWINTEKAVRKYLHQQKYYNLIKKAIYVTASQAKMEHNADSTLYTLKFVMKRYAEIADSTIKVSDEEAKAYYDKNLYKFKEKENKRSMDYVAFDIFPSTADIENVKNKMSVFATKLQAQKTLRDDTILVSQEGLNMTEQKFSPGQFPLGQDSAFLKTPVGGVVGPIQMGENLNIYKVRSNRMLADSGRVRHILISYQGAGGGGNARTKDQAKKLADSLVAVIKKGTKMETLVEKYTDDPGSKPQPDSPDEKMKKGNKGDYGFIKNNGQMVAEFTEYALTKKVGETAVVETQFGYHVMQCLERAKTEKPEMKVAVIEKPIEASDATINEVYNKASEFALKNATGEAFAAAIKKDNLNKIMAPDIVEAAPQINGIQEGSKPVVKWLFGEETEKGAVSQPFMVGKRYIVCALTAVKDKGYKSLEDSRTIIDVEVRKEKKAAMFVDQLNKQKGATIDAYAANLKMSVMASPNVTFTNPNLLGAGPEGDVVGKLANMKKGQLTGPIIGNTGVYVVYIEDVKAAGELKNVKAKQTNLMMRNVYSVEGSAYDVLKENADITDNRSKIF